MITIERARELLTYDAQSGDIRWAQDVKSEKRNRCYIRKGMIAGSVAGRYRTIKIDGKTYMAHKLAWFLVHGEWPKIILDHANRDGLDNRLCNLRPATRFQNQANRSKPRHNTSGHKGALWRPDLGRWVGLIVHRGKPYHLGVFDTAEEAGRAYAVASVSLNGEFASF